MATQDTHAHSPGPWERLARLFNESWRRARKRRVRYLLVALAIAAAAAVTVRLTSGGGAGTSASPAQRLTTAVASTRLPASGGYTSLSVAGGKLVAIGTAHGSCVSAVINPTTLGASDLLRGSCNDPAIRHERVMPLVSTVERIDRADGNNPLAGIRIAITRPGSPSGYNVGPVVMRYPVVSTSHPEWIYGDGSLWIYDDSANGNFSPTTGGELLRISTSTDTVVQHWRLSNWTRPLLAVNADGLWIARSINTGGSGGLSLYLAAPGVTKLRRSTHLGPGGARWMVASGNNIWLESNGAPSSNVTREHLQGPHAKLITTVKSRSTNPQGTGDTGEGQSFYGGSTAMGVYDVVTPFNYATGHYASVVWMNPITLAPQRVKARLGAPENYSYNPSVTTYDGSFFVLNPSGTGAELYRVKTTPAG